MKLHNVKIENYRAIKSLDLEFNSSLTVFHGDNAHGKTSLLSAIAVGLGAVPLLLPDVSGISFKKRDRRTDASGVRIRLTTNEGISWERTYGIPRSTSRIRRSGIETVKNPLRELKKWLENHAMKSLARPLDLPVMAFYDTERAVSNLRRTRSRSKRDFSRFSALSGALSARTDFRELFEWFYIKENEELREQRDRRNLDFRLKELSVVRNAISSMVKSVSDPHVELRPLQFVVSERLDDGTIDKRTLDQLSGGYKAVLALAADLAWRMAQANPHKHNPLESEAVVLIDEIELHLHPAWQQTILDDLTRTFPSAQFIVTTHSPQVLTTVRPEQVVRLQREDKGIVAEYVSTATFGAESGDVLFAVMGVDERPKSNNFVEMLSDYKNLIEIGMGGSNEAMALREKLEATSPRDPALLQADIEISRQEVLKEFKKSK